MPKKTHPHSPAMRMMTHNIEMFSAFFSFTIFTSCGRAASVVKMLAINPTQVILSIFSLSNTSARAF